ncbi:hypothetical protein BGZ61DRAFT_468181 [Ilyonectria robusta]|uniref:uncharacterized protein n=1 Tax=Ilyonectria robusta TaxID=1079257 RepID=UPI001E8E1EE4|nr:uncharacterized protein BGZ61DRAFT_468181 [Ilyonectria robusta]KAH8653038.1 hypothetical protein BGZ61DRAFT_468181 [Ilyonectria robusta]
MRGMSYHRNTCRKLLPYSLIDSLSSWQQPIRWATIHPTEIPSSQCQIRAQSRPCENLVFWKPHLLSLSEWDQATTTLSATKNKELWYPLNSPRWTHLSCRAASSRNSCKRVLKRAIDSAGYRR